MARPKRFWRLRSAIREYLDLSEGTRWIRRIPRFIVRWAERAV